MKHLQKRVIKPKNIWVKRDNLLSSFLRANRGSRAEDAVIAQFTMFENKRNPKYQRIFGPSASKKDGLDRFYVERIKGKTLEQALDKKNTRAWLAKNQDALAKETAKILVDHMRKGVYHGDLGPTNLILSYKKTKQGIKPILRVIDYGLAKPASKTIRREYQAEMGKKEIDEELTMDTEMIVHNLAARIFKGTSFEEKREAFKKKVHAEIEKQVEEQF